jgi:threonine/homoserine/homoserine lactone efflux protein
MSPDLLVPASLFALVSSITPGPNNTMLLASGVNFGFRRTLRHLLGVQIGFCVMLLSVGLGLHTVITRFPGLYDGLRWAGGAYLLWLAWKLAHASPMQSELHSAAQPMGFFAAAGFQALNPKAWVMAVTSMSTYLPAQAAPVQVLLLTALFALVGGPCSAFWAAFGSAMRTVLQDPRRLRLFNIAMALALVASLYPMLA